MDPIRIGIIMGSTRPGRKAEAVARWAYSLASKRVSATYELIDLLEFHLPLLDEPNPPMMGKYTKEHTLRWSEKIGGLDAFVFVAPEYNHGISGALKNAIDFLFHEWNHKAAGFIGYGSAGGTRAVESLRLVMGEILVADVRVQVALSLRTDFEGMKDFRPHPAHEATLGEMLDQVEAWGGALRELRSKQAKLRKTA